MIKEEKSLLLQDLSARLPYGVIIDPVDCGKAILVGIKDGGLLLFDTIQKKEYDKPFDIEYIKPYLRSMSSMTEEEKEELRILRWTKLEYHLVDWLQLHHFDYRGLIEKGLALEAPEGMYNVK
jgi:hypothetical protein